MINYLKKHNRYFCKCRSHLNTFKQYNNSFHRASVFQNKNIKKGNSMTPFYGLFIPALNHSLASRDSQLNISS